MIKMIRNFFNGLAFGITETIPGVSGGTIAIILGFYNELINFINHFTEDLKKYSKFFVPFALGLACGILMFSSIINYLLNNYIWLWERVEFERGT
jgi:putative membrane protein